MTAKRKLARPTWAAIKKYIEGRLLDERQRVDARLTAEGQARRADAAQNAKVVDAIAQEVARHADLLGEPKTES